MPHPQIDTAGNIRSFVNLILQKRKDAALLKQQQRETQAQASQQRSIVDLLRGIPQERFAGPVTQEHQLPLDPETGQEALIPGLAGKPRDQVSAFAKLFPKAASNLVEQRLSPAPTAKPLSSQEQAIQAQKLRNLEGIEAERSLDIALKGQELVGEEEKERSVPVEILNSLGFDPKVPLTFDELKDVSSVKLEASKILNASRGTKLSPSEKKQVTSNEAANLRADDFKDAFEKVKDGLGNIEGRVKKFSFSNLGGKGLSGNESAYFASQSSMFNFMIKLITGAQVRESEERRILDEVPNHVDTPQQWIKKWEQTKKNIINLQKAMEKAGIEGLAGEDEGISEDEEVANFLSTFTGTP